MATVAPLENSTVEVIADPPLTLKVEPVWRLDDAQFFAFCQLNRELRIERNAQKELILMPPTGMITGSRNAEIIMQLRLWAKQEGSGIALDCATGFKLPNGAMRSPDAAWVRKSRLAVLHADDLNRFPPLCPDFVIELRSSTDSLVTLENKLQEYIDNGAQLGWLIDPVKQQVAVYRPGAPVQTLNKPDTLSAAPVIDFVLDLRDVWSPL